MLSHIRFYILFLLFAHVMTSKNVHFVNSRFTHSRLMMKQILGIVLLLCLQNRNPHLPREKILCIYLPDKYPAKL